MKMTNDERIETACRAWWTCAIDNGKTSPQDGFRAGVMWAAKKIREKGRGKRSDPQNRYYWGMVIKILREHFGYTKNGMHDAIGIELRIEHHDNGPPTIESTANMDTKRFEEYLEEVRLWAYHKYQVSIPLPNEFDI